MRGLKFCVECCGLSLGVYILNFPPRSTAPINWKNHSFPAFCRWRMARTRGRRRRKARNSTSSRRIPRRTLTLNRGLEGVNGERLAKRYPCYHCCCCRCSSWTRGVGATEASISFSAHILLSLPLSNTSQHSEWTTEDMCEEETLHFFLFLFIIFKIPRLYFMIQFLLSLPPQELKDTSSPAGSAMSVLESSPMKRSEQREQIYECMGEFRDAVWANTLSRACFTLSTSPLLTRSTLPKATTTIHTPKNHNQSTPLQPGPSTAFDFYFMTHVTSVSLLPFRLFLSLLQTMVE